MDETEHNYHDNNSKTEIVSTNFTKFTFNKGC